VVILTMHLSVCTPKSPIAVESKPYEYCTFQPLLASRDPHGETELSSLLNFSRAEFVADGLHLQ